MASRYELHEIFKKILGSPYVYFCPPPNVKLCYPCIIYRLAEVDTKFADNLPYSRKKRYRVTIITSDPDSELPDKIGALPMSKFDRYYVADNLHHHDYNIYH